MAVVGIAREKMGSPGPLRETADGFSITREFLVTVDSHADDGIVVDRAVGLPQRGNIYQTSVSSHPFLFCVRRDIRRLSEKGLTWVVSCEYETPRPGQNNQQNQNQQMPEFDLPQISGGSSSELRDFIKTGEEVPEIVTNTAGEPFLPQPKKEVFFPSLTIRRNEPITTPIGQVQLMYVGKCNSDTFWGLGAGTWRCVGIPWETGYRTFANGLTVSYLSVTYEFHAKDDWDWEALNEGKNYIGPSGKLVGFMAANGLPRSGLLNSDGTGEVTGANAIFVKRRVYERVAFAGLNLPQSPLAAVQF